MLEYVHDSDNAHPWKSQPCLLHDDGDDWRIRISSLTHSLHMDDRRDRVHGDDQGVTDDDPARRKSPRTGCTTL